MFNFLNKTSHGTLGACFSAFALLSCNTYGNAEPDIQLLASNVVAAISSREQNFGTTPTLKWDTNKLDLTFVYSDENRRLFESSRIDLFESVFREIGQHTGIEINVLRGTNRSLAPDVIVVYGNRSDILRDALRLARILNIRGLSAILDEQDSANLPLCTFSLVWTSGGEILRALITVEEGRHIRRCISEEVVQAMGVTGDITSSIPSILGPNLSISQITNFDRLALQVLYDDRTRPGVPISENEVLQILTDVREQQ